MIDLKEIEGNEYSVNVCRYVENGDKEELIDVSGVWKELVALEAERARIDTKVDGYLKKLKY